MLTQTGSQDDRAEPPPGNGGGLARSAPAIWAVSRVGKGHAHRRGRPGFSRGKMQAGDCILRPWEGTDFCQDGLSVLVKIWAWETHTDTLFQTAGTSAMCISYVGYPQNCDIRPGVRVFRISGFSARRTIFMLMSNRAALIRTPDITRLLAGVLGAGLFPDSIAVDNTGRIEITLRGDDPGDGRRHGANPCDRLLKGGTK